MASWLDRLLAPASPVARPVCDVVCLACPDPLAPRVCTDRRARGMPSGCEDAFASSRCLHVRTDDLRAALAGRTVPDPALHAPASCHWFQDTPILMPVDLQQRLLDAWPAEPPADA